MFSTAVPSPQSTVAVRFSSQPASLITPVTVIGEFSGCGPSSARSSTVGATLLTVTVPEAVS